MVEQLVLVLLVIKGLYNISNGDANNVHSGYHSQNSCATTTVVGVTEVPKVLVILVMVVVVVVVDVKVKMLIMIPLSGTSSSTDDGDADNKDGGGEYDSDGDVN